MNPDIQKQALVLILAMIIIAIPCFSHSEETRSLKITATAYNSLPGQTQGDPRLTAWGETLKSGMQAIAVSQDLIRMGLTHGIKVKIEGFPGTYAVMDKLHKRWKLRIDIYMGDDVKAAKQFGKRKVTIQW